MSIFAKVGETVKCIAIGRDSFSHEGTFIVRDISHEDGWYTLIADRGEWAGKEVDACPYDFVKVEK